MKRYLGILPASALAVVLAFSAQTALAGIDNSKHDLGTVDAAGTTSQICVFCHTPHGSNVAVDAPLWNKGLPNVTYTPYTSATLDSDTSVVSGVSLACLSCHDGTQARDNFINGPGSGNYNASGVSYGGMSSLSGLLGAGSVVVLGTNLSNDHPVSMYYAGIADPVSAVNGTTVAFADKDFNILKTDALGVRIWVDTPAASGIGGGTLGGTFEKTDLPLYGADKLEVQCGTCHDPHSTTAGTFLRTSNTASALCLSCHNK